LTPSPLLSILEVVAPTLIGKLKEVIEDGQVKSKDVQTVIYAMMAENNGQYLELMKKMDKRLELLEGNCKTCGEGMVILLKRTEH